MQDKLITKGNLERVLGWISIALQAVQEAIPTKTSDLTNDSKFVTASDNNVNIPAQSGNYRRMLSTTGSVLQWMDIGIAPVESGGTIPWYIYEHLAGLYYFPSDHPAIVYVRSVFEGDGPMSLALDGGIMSIDDNKEFVYIGKNNGRPVFVYGNSNTTTGSATIIDLDMSLKQDVLVSGENIKTVNGQSLLGSGNIPIEGGGTSSYDFTHTANTTISGSAATVTFAAGQRCTRMLTVSADLGLSIACNNLSDNYLWIRNSGSSEVDVTISEVTANNATVSNVYVPSDGITVPAGGLCEIGVIVNADGAFITSRNDLSL